MSAAIHRAAALAVMLPLLFPLTESFARSDSVDDGRVAHAYGTLVDSITVTGNKHTKTYVILREMETRTGDVLVAKSLRRDIRFLNDLSPFAEVEVRADSLAPGHCALRIRVTERSGLFLKSLLPFIKYDFEKGLTYGLRWRDKNFRGRLEHLSFTYTRNEQDDDDAGFSWVAPWIGWRHIAVGGRVNYFNRGDPPASVSVLERTGVGGFVALPLTESRIRFAQGQASVFVEKTRNGAINEPTSTEVTLSPQLGYRFDSRDSQINPQAGQTLFFGVGASFPLAGGRGSYYRLRNETRWFVRASKKSVIALLSNLVYQFGDFPDYSTVKLGGAKTLRGHPDSRFSGFHRWFQTLEYRYEYLPRTVVRLPLVKQVDVGLAFVTFIDGGIAWNGSSDFGLGRFHGTGGLGIRFYQPLQDVVRADFGFNTRGDARFHFGTGIRF